MPLKLGLPIAYRNIHTYTYRKMSLFKKNNQLEGKEGDDETEKCQ